MPLLLCQKTLSRNLATRKLKLNEPRLHLCPNTLPPLSPPTHSRAITTSAFSARSHERQLQCNNTFASCPPYRIILSSTTPKCVIPKRTVSRYTSSFRYHALTDCSPACKPTLLLGILIKDCVFFYFRNIM